MPVFYVEVTQRVTYSLAVAAPTAGLAAALVNRERIEGPYGLDKYIDNDDCTFIVRRAKSKNAVSVHLGYDEDTDDVPTQIAAEYAPDYTLTGED